MLIILGLLAFLSGMATVLSIMVNARLAKQEGMVNGIFVSYVVALITSTILCAIMLNTIPAYKSLRTIPLPYLLGGFLGVLTTYIFNIIVHKLPAVTVLILRFISQILASVLIDYLYFHIFSVGKLMGVLLFAAGLLINSKADQKVYLTE